MIPTITSHLVFLLAKPLSQKNQTQCPGIILKCPGIILKCPGIILKCPGITQLPSLVMRARARPLKISQAPCGIIPTSPKTRVLALVTVTQCPGLMCKTVIMYNRKTVSLPPKKKRNRQYRRERRARERAERGEVFNHDARWTSQRPGDPSSSSVPAQVTQPGLQDSDPISAMRPAVYYPHESVGSSRTNENSPFQIDLESGEFSGLRPGLYKPADPVSQHDTRTYSSIANSLETGPPSPTRTLAANSSDSRTRPGIVYPP